MNAPRGPRKLSPTNEELLFEAALGDGTRRADSRVRLATDPSARADLRDLETRLERAQTAFRDVPGFDRARERALVERILASTEAARKRARFRGPRWLPVAAAAAALVACALALAHRLPALLGAPDAAPTVTVVRVADLRPEGGLAEVLALARAELATTASAGVEARRLAAERVSDAPLELRLLEARAKGLRERRWEPWLTEVPLAEVGPLALALWCEIQLDRFALTGARPPAWSKALDILEHGLARDADDAAAPEASRLLAHALGRARDYGWDGRAPAAGADAAKPLWTRQWFSDLEAAGRSAGLAETGPWRAWVEWRGF